MKLPEEQRIGDGSKKRERKQVKREDLLLQIYGYYLYQHHHGKLDREQLQKRRSSSWFSLRSYADKALITEIMLISIFQKRGRPSDEKAYSAIKQQQQHQQLVYSLKEYCEAKQRSCYFYI